MKDIEEGFVDDLQLWAKSIEEYIDDIYLCLDFQKKKDLMHIQLCIQKMINAFNKKK